MTKQKKGFLVFVCSLVPGAGEMYMGFRKKGVSIMGIFWGIVTVAACLDFAFLNALLPIVWCYSFFDVHNLKSLTEEEFYSLEDDYEFHLDRMIENKQEFFQKYKSYICVGIILVGFFAFWNSIPIFFVEGISEPFYSIFYYVREFVPRVATAFIIIGAGVYLLTKKRSQQNSEWEHDRIEDKML